MEHLTLWIAFWIVTLSGGLPTGHRRLSMDDLNINSLQASLLCANNSNFYTPSKVEGDCITAALECFQIELKGTVRVECEYPEENIRQAVEFLDFAIRQRSRDVNATAASDSAECPCERWPTTNITNFLNAIEPLIQQINNEALIK
uniref:Interleukin n=1 Tax=Sparus aurata TaxID=8175 RepID=A0A671W9E1_SPAAU